MNRGERRALRHYRLRGYRLVAANVHAGGYELDLVVRRGRRLVVAEVKEKGGDGYGDPLEMVSPEKARRVMTAARVWLGSHPESSRLDVSFEAVGVRGRRVERVPLI
ncbi:MAG TPA: YraN family protein [Gaiellaceae bacterium]